MTTKPTVLITGANRGIGLELARQYAAAGWDVIGCCRSPQEAGDLKALKGKVEVKALDVGDAASIQKLAAELKGRAIDVLLNNAGILGRRVGFGQSETVEFLDLQRVNALAPLLMAEAFVEHVASSGQKKIAAITSGLASITNVDDAASYAYRASKASLNMVMRKLAHDLKGRGVLAAAISPLAWRRRDSVASVVVSHCPWNIASIRSRTPGDGIEAPAGRQCTHTAPPAATWNARCGPGVAHRAHSSRAGIHPAQCMARSRNASRISWFSRVCDANARSAPTVSRCRSASAMARWCVALRAPAATWKLPCREPPAAASRPPRRTHARSRMG